MVIALWLHVSYFGTHTGEVEGVLSSLFTSLCMNVAGSGGSGSCAQPGHHPWDDMVLFLIP